MDPMNHVKNKSIYFFAWLIEGVSFHFELLKQNEIEVAEVINDPLGHTHSPNIRSLFLSDFFCLAVIWKVGTDISNMQK